MKFERRFLIARSLARLIQRESRAIGRVVEAFFAPQPNRTQLVRITPDGAQLILDTRTGDEWERNAADVPLSHAASLVEVASGHLAYDRTIIPIGDGRCGFVDRIFEPGQLDLVTLAFAPREGAEFELPTWFGREVTQDTAFANVTMAFRGVPEAHEEISNDTLEALLHDLDDLYGRAEIRQSGAYAGPTSLQAPSELKLSIKSRTEDVMAHPFTGRSVRA